MRIDWVKSIPFLLMHLAAFSVLLVPFEWKWVGCLAFSYYLRMFGVTAGFHRYFSHRSYKLGRAAQFAMAWMGTMAMQKGVLWWAANHRLHHRHSDQPEDIHSPLQRGFWWSHVGWILVRDHEATRWDQIQDLSKFPELRWLNRWHLVPPLAFAAVLYAAGGFAALAWGFFLGTVVLWHGTFTVNSLAHVFGSRRYVTTDTSRNNAWLVPLTLGEGWHNNHHAWMSSARQGFFWWEIDPSYLILKALSWAGVVRDLRDPPLAQLEARRVDRAPAEDHSFARARAQG
jgi:stearoyl-CoA desaturase (delta-9 desaturase)